MAERGFHLDHSYARGLKAVAGALGKFDSSRAVFFKDGKPLQQGDLLKQPDLAKAFTKHTVRFISEAEVVPRYNGASFFGKAPW